MLLQIWQMSNPISVGNASLIINYLVLCQFRPEIQIKYKTCVSNNSNGTPSCQDELIRQILLGFYLHLNINKWWPEYKIKGTSQQLSFLVLQMFELIISTDV